MPLPIQIRTSRRQHIVGQAMMTNSSHSWWKTMVATEERYASTSRPNQSLKFRKDGTISLIQLSKEANELRQRMK